MVGRKMKQWAWVKATWRGAQHEQRPGGRKVTILMRTEDRKTQKVWG